MTEVSRSDEGTVRCTIRDGVAHVIFDRPAARNAMTWRMYEELGQACERIAAEPAVRVATFRGAGGEAFVAGTDIRQFLDFVSGEDGLAYERRIDAGIDQLERLPVPTVAVVEGWCFGGGLAIAAACDFRLATPNARFGVPIARTLGNCLSIANVARLLAHLGPARTKRLLMLAEAIGSEEAVACGFVLKPEQPEALDAHVDELCRKLKSHAPITVRASKEAVRRLVAAGHPEGDDLIRAAYGSEDFRTGIRAFLAKRPAEWRNS